MSHSSVVLVLHNEIAGITKFIWENNNEKHFSLFVPTYLVTMTSSTLPRAFCYHASKTGFTLGYTGASLINFQ